MQNNQRGLIQIVVILILLAGIVVTVWLVTQGPLKLFPKAGISKPIPPETSLTLIGPNVCHAGWICALQFRGEPLPGEEFEVKLYARSDIDEANLFQARMSFPKDLLEVVKINTDGSFVANWVEDYYDNSAGEINLTGGVPSPGFKTQMGQGSAFMATIVFKAKTAGIGKVLFTNDSQILRNSDNQNILTIKRDAEISIAEGPPLPKDYLVKPYLVYPADKPVYLEYEQAVRQYMLELQNWYKEKVGETFNMAPLQVVKSKYNYDIMRCDPSPFDQIPPAQSCLNDPKKLESNWAMYMNLAVHNGVEKWEEKTAALIFSAGGGGYAGANKYGNDAGFAITGDWVLEPISGKANDWGIPCKYSDGWQCAGGVPGGSPAHELGHVFGLPHPDEKKYPGERVSIMRWHGDYPQVGFLPHEVEFLKKSPFFSTSDVCIQAITPAKDPRTGVCKEFPTPCDVPEGWEKVGSCTPDGCEPPPPPPPPGCNYIFGDPDIRDPNRCPVYKLVCPNKKGDGNSDGKVNLVDMSVLLTDFNKEKGFREPIDMNGDGKINTFDFSLHRKLLIDLGIIKGQ